MSTMPLITLEQIYLAYGLNPLLDKIKLQINKSERICLIGRNGEGKSSLLKIIAGTIQPDSGTIWRKPNLRISTLEQTLPGIDISVFDYVAQGLEHTGKIISAYHQVLQQLESSSSPKLLNQLEKVQHEMDVAGAWHFEQQIAATLMRLNLDGNAQLQRLSGGWQKRAALARALVSDPELLLLDEPTNHLDVAAITWLEETLLSTNISLLFITHDRALLQRIATRIIELDRGNLTSWDCDYQSFLQRKAELLDAELKHNADFDKKLAQEEKWIRQGIKARRTRNEGRLRELIKLRKERSERREIQSSASFGVNKADQSGQLVINAINIGFGIGKKQIIKNFTLRIMRGDRIGLIGPNGIGKSTLLNILLGKLEPQQGKIILGTKLEVAYFDQLRAKLDLEKTVIENVTEGQDMLEINGKPLHVMSYLNQFLFAPQRARTPVKALSGGECNRLLLAKLFAKPANLLVLDEPTNDLDIETLELLEEILMDYPGTLLIVSHDRTFLNNVVTSTLVFKGEGKIQEYVGGYDDYLQQAQQELDTIAENPAEKKTSLAPVPQIAKRKMSYKEEQELNILPEQIEKLEAKQLALQTEMSAPHFYEQDQQQINKFLAELAKVDEKLNLSYERWETLEAQNLQFKK